MSDGDVLASACQRQTNERRLLIRIAAMQEVKFRLVNPGLRPRRTKLEMPGWAGKPEARTDGAQEYPWHCAPFTEGAQYGIEVFYRRF